MIPENIDALKKMDKAFKNQQSKQPISDKKQYVFSSKQEKKDVKKVEESGNKYIRKFKQIGANFSKQNEKFFGFR